MRVLLAAKRRLTRDGLRYCLSEPLAVEVVAEVADIPELLAGCRGSDVDAVIIDASLLEGYLDGGLPVDGFADARDSTGQGTPRIPPGNAGEGMGDGVGGGTRAGAGAGDDELPHRIGRLTSRERQVFHLLGHGMSNRSIARHLAVTERTVKSYVGRILDKLGVESRLQAGLLAFALRNPAGLPGSLVRSSAYRAGGRAPAGRSGC